MFFSHKANAIVGVDIGTSYIKVAQISHGQQKTLDTYGIVNVSSHIDIYNNEAAIDQTASILKTLLAKAGVTTKRAVVSLPNSAVFTSVIDMPAMSETELASAMPFEAKKYVPLPFSEVILSWSVVVENKEAKTMKILLIAVPKQVQESYLQVFDRAGLELEIIEIEALALIRSVILDAKSNDVIIDIGAKSTGLNIIKSGFLQLTRNLNIGGDTITDRIAQTLNITTARAEQFKKDFGVSQSASVPEAIKPVLNVIKTEIKQLLTIYKAHNMNVDAISLVGGGSNLPGIAEFFADLGAKVSLGDPLSRISYPSGISPVLERFKLQLPIAIGLALRDQDTEK
jgi:type IV pilus assembly protein PilM